MGDFARALGASKSALTLLVLFVPSKDRTDQNIDQVYWVNQALTVLGLCSGAPHLSRGVEGYGVTMHGAASCPSTSPWSSNATPESRRWSGRHRTCRTSCTAWDARPARERSVSSSTGTTSRSPFRSRSPRRPSPSTRNGSKQHG